MMQRPYLLLLLLAWMCMPRMSHAQCPGCLMNTSFSAPGIYPDTLPAGTMGLTYDQDVTFVMFTDTQGLTVNYFQIASVSGLPFGLNWQCNNSGNGCTYNPANSIYGCVKICGTPLQSGFFVIHVGVIANLQLVGNQNSNIDLYLQVSPPTGGNASFTFSPSSGCDSATVHFQATITSATNPVSYHWDFGNGDTSILQNPTEHFSAPGDYMIILHTEVLAYQVTDVFVYTMNTNWCGDVEEPSLPIVGCTGSPDPFFDLGNSGGSLYTSSYFSDVNSASWHGLTIPLSGPPYSITIWDYDPVSPNDNLGTFAFNVSGTGTQNFGGGGTTGAITIGTSVITSATDTDYVHIYASPAIPFVSASRDTICQGDSVLLTASNVAGDFLQWTVDGNPIPNATHDSLQVTGGGSYSVQATNAYGCSAESGAQSIFVSPLPPKPTFTISGNTLHCVLTGYPLQWYSSGVALPGATGSSYTISQNGYYYVVASNSAGCTHSSDTVMMTYNGINDITLFRGVTLYPNPATDHVSLSVSLAHPCHLEVDLSDLVGRQVMRQNYPCTGGKNELQLDLRGLPSGVYTIRLWNQEQEMLRKVVLE